MQNSVSKRPDIIFFVNGLLLVVIELKNPADKKCNCSLIDFKYSVSSKKSDPALHNRKNTAM